LPCTFFSELTEFPESWRHRRSSRTSSTGGRGEAAHARVWATLDWWCRHFLATNHDGRANRQSWRPGKGSWRTRWSATAQWSPRRCDGVDLVRESGDRSGAAPTRGPASWLVWLEEGKALGEAELLLERRRAGRSSSVLAGNDHEEGPTHECDEWSAFAG
jgi:hypothetical protein